MQNYGWHPEGIVRKKPKNRNKKGKKYKALRKNNTNFEQANNEDKDMWEELLQLKNEHHINIIEDGKNQDHLDGDDFFCNLPTSSYSRVVIGTDSKEHDLWSVEGILAQCHIDSVLRANSRFSSLCQTERNGADQKCCRSWSPANYIALLSNRSSCLGVTEDDLNRVKTLLQRCAYYYHNHQLLPNCAEDFNCQRHVPTECYARNVAYHMLHYLLDVNFMPNHVRTHFLFISSIDLMRVRYPF